MENLQTFISLKEAGFFGGLLCAVLIYQIYFKKAKKDAKESHIRCADCMNITGVIETAEKNNTLLEKLIKDIDGNTELLKDVLNQVKKNNKLQQLQLLKGVEANELQRIVSIVGEE